MLRSDRLERLRARRNPDPRGVAIFSEAYQEKGERPDTEYVLGSMQPVSDRYTEICYEESNRIQKQLEANRSSIYDGADFRHQGSVTNHTHIKGHSDIDLITFLKRFVYLERPQVPSVPYNGDDKQDILDLRIECVSILRRKFYEATVDDSGAKSISLSGGSLRRKIDVVPAAWYDSNRYAEHRDEMFRGITILDKNKKQTIDNFPFLHNARIQARDTEYNGNLRRVIRMLKNIRSDADVDIDVSSYAICGLCYAMPNNYLNNPPRTRLLLLHYANEWLKELVVNDYRRDSLKTINEKEPLLPDASKAKRELAKLQNETSQLLGSVTRELQYSHRVLNEATFVD